MLEGKEGTPHLLLHLLLLPCTWNCSEEESTLLVRRVINIIPSLTKDHLLKFNPFLAVSICFIGVYSPIIKEQFGLKQGTIQFVGTVGNIGAWFLIPAGYSFDAYGPRPGIVIGVILCCVGYLVLWGVISNRISYSTALLAFAAFGLDWAAEFYRVINF